MWFRRNADIINFKSGQKAFAEGKRKRVLEGHMRNWNKNSICPDSTPKGLRTQSGRKAFAKGKRKRVLEGHMRNWNKKGLTQNE